MKLLWADQAWSDYLHFQTSDAKIRDRINDLIKEAKR
ncbi:MAG: type II toxin-antitoxin system YoeB family toxin, partial [Aurantimonas coralicida]|nr:type II toxin-antitoxin system YoeB family toxin [Aurantimonas coralicida]